MPITELVFSHFKPETAKEALAAIRIGSKSFDGSTGLLLRRVGHIIRHNGEDIATQCRAVLGLQWEKAENFHALFPNSPAFTGFIGSIMPYVAAKATPQLFQPSGEYERSERCFKSEVTQIFTGPVGATKGEVDGAWATLISTLEKERSIEHWSGTGIEGAEGVWLGILGWKGLDEFDDGKKNATVYSALQKFKKSAGLEEFVVNFEE